MRRILSAMLTMSTSIRSNMDMLHAVVDCRSAASIVNVEHGLLAEDWGGDMREIQGSFASERWARREARLLPTLRPQPQG